MVVLFDRKNHAKVNGYHRNGWGDITEIAMETQQYQIRQTLSDGYIKKHTVFNESEYVGCVNIAGSTHKKFQK